MRISLATNFDNQLPEAIRGTAVRELFGKLSSDAVGGGRSSYMLAKTSKWRLIEHIRQAHWCGMEFNYLLNAACLDNREFSRKGQREIRSLLDWLSEIGVDWVTVSTPFLLEIIKTSYPNLRAKVGVFAEVNSPSSAKHWEDLGADRITLPPITLNRNFEQLQAMRESVECDLELLVNHTCLPDCPFREYHKLLLSHSSQKGHPGKFVVDYCLLKCQTLRLTDPAYYIKSPWIRPEDLHIYESMGYKSIKVLERGAPTTTLVTRARAYSERYYEGNLLDIIQPFGFKGEQSKTQPKRSRFWDIRQFLRPWKASSLDLLKWREFAMLQGMANSVSDGAGNIHIDNRSLDGFLEGLPKSCRNSSNCSRCSYCDDFARSSMQVEDGFRSDSLDLAYINLSKMLKGTFWQGL